MSIDSFIPELWAAKLLAHYHAAQVYTQPTVANRDYEGEIKEQGDTVRINQIGAPEVRGYTRGDNITFDKLATSSQELLVNQADYFAFYVNDVDKVQAAADFGSDAMKEAALKLRAKSDAYAGGLLRDGVKNENKIGRVKVVAGGTGLAGSDQITAYDLLVQLAKKLDDNDVPEEGRYVVVDPGFIAAARMDPRFANVAASGSDQTLRNGQLLRAAGFDILRTSAVPKVGKTGADKNDSVIIAGVSGAFSFVNQITSIEPGRREAGFDDFVKGLNVYGGKVTRPHALASATVEAYQPGTGAMVIAR